MLPENNPDPFTQPSVRYFRKSHTVPAPFLLPQVVVSHVSTKYPALQPTYSLCYHMFLTEIDVPLTSAQCMLFLVPKILSCLFNDTQVYVNSCVL